MTGTEGLRHPHRYQLNKQALIPFKSGHPWIFRNNLSSAIEPFKNGQWLRLVDGNNATQGFGILEKTDGLIGIRVLSHEEDSPNPKWLRERVKLALQKRHNVRRYAEAYRAIHGENDGLPGVVVDVYGETGVLQTYAPSTDLLGRYVALIVRAELGLKSMVWKMPAKRKHQEGETALRILYGFPPKHITFREGKMNLTVEPMTGQKSGAFLDLRGLRKWISSQDLRGGHVLNLFSYTGTLGLAAEKAGAASTLNVDISKGALETAAKYHRVNPSKQQYLAADIFEWIKQPERKKDIGKYSAIIVDPPMMASRTEQVPRVMQKYLQLYNACLPLLKPNGYIIVACCTSRVKRDAFKKIADSAFLATATCRFIHDVRPEEDHPVAFTEGDYLKIFVYQRKAPKNG